MKLITSFLAVLLLSQSLLADSLVNRQRRLAIHNLKTSFTGQELLAKLPSGIDLHKLVIFDEIEGPTKLRLHQIVKRNGETKINLNAELLASNPMYLSWVLASAINEYRVHLISKKHGVKLPRFIESSQWMMLWAMKHWQDKGLPNKFDYAQDPNDNLAEVARKLIASTTIWTNHFKASPSDFFMRVRLRHQNLEFGNLYIEDYISNSRGSKKIAAKKLLEALNEELN